MSCGMTSPAVLGSASSVGTWLKKGPWSCHEWMDGGAAQKQHSISSLQLVRMHGVDLCSSTFSNSRVVASSWPQWAYSRQRNWQMLHIRTLILQWPGCETFSGIHWLKSTWIGKAPALGISGCCTVHAKRSPHSAAQLSLPPSAAASLEFLFMVSANSLIPVLSPWDLPTIHTHTYNIQLKVRSHWLGVFKTHCKFWQMYQGLQGWSYKKKRMKVKVHSHSP